ncbi:MAG TPA: glycosyltransferase family A protein [Patescibacteria group bacterium]
MEKVSVIIPTKNEENNLEFCLKSIKNQTYKNVEIIVIDNFSKDSTLTIARKYTRKIYKKGPERSGQRNFGAKIAKGKYLLFIDADMILENKTISQLIKSKSKAAIVPETINPDNFWASCRKLEKKLYDNSIVEAPRFFEKILFNKIGGYDNNLYAAEDWDITEKIEKYKIEISRIKSKIIHREQNLNPLSAAKKKFYYGKNISKFMLKNKAGFLKRASPFRVNYFKYLISDPTHTIGLVVLKICEGLGLIFGMTSKAI